MTGDVEKMIAVGLIWGATNALIRRGALLYDKRSLRSPSSAVAPTSIRRKLIASFKSSISLLLFWQYSLPFLLNLSASATFFALLSDAPISLAVPVTNATTFAVTAVFGMLLGEETRIGFAFVGTAFIVAGIWLCIT
ncbi:Transmembrane protein 234 homolog [Linum grandiflorum]